MISNFVKILKTCEFAADPANKVDGPKFAIRLALSTMDSTTLRLLYETMNSYRVFGIRKFEQPAAFAKVDPSDVSHVFETLDALCDRKLTGNAARSAVTSMLSTFTEESAKYLERIIDKDPRAGFSVDTVNKVLIAREMGGDLAEALKKVDKLLKVKGIRQFENFACFASLIPTFEVQLADKCESEEDYEELIFPCQADIKYDGERNVGLVTEEVHYFSRSGKEVFHLPESIAVDLQLLRGWIQKNGFPKEWNVGDETDFVLDGERVGTDFEKTMNAKKKFKVGETSEAREGLFFRAFFLMPLSHWKAQQTNITMKQGREFLLKILSEVHAPKIVISEGKVVNDFAEMMAYCNSVIDDESRQKYEREGLILKQLNDVYRWERNTAWMKIKRFYPIDCKVVGWYYGRPKSKIAGFMGGVIIEGTDEKGAKVRSRCGSGFSLEQRKNPKQFENATLEIKYQEMTLTKKNKETGIYCVRFPTVERVRTDKDVEALQERRWFGISLEEAGRICGE